VKDIDFLPHWYRQARHRRDLRISRVWLGMIGLCALGIWLAAGNLQMDQAQARLDHLTDQNQTIQKGLDLMAELETEQTGLLVRYELAQELSPRRSCVEILSKLAELIPPQVSLKELEVISKVVEDRAKSGDKLTTLAAKISGKTSSEASPSKRRTIEMTVNIVGLAPSEMDVAILVGQLGSCRDFLQVRLEYCKASTIEQCRGYSFKATLTVEAASLPVEKSEDS